MPSSFKRTLSFKFTHQTSVSISLPSHACDKTRPFNPPCFHHTNNAWRKETNMKPLITQFSPSQWKYLSYHSVLEHLSLCSFLKVSGQVLRP